MADTLTVLRERGFIQQCTDEKGLETALASGPNSFYVGVDPTGISLHVGHMVPLFAMAHLQRAGHKPLAVVGGGTALIGDPSGKTEMRKIQSVETIQKNAEAIKKQIGRIVDFSDGKAKLLNNYDWLANLNYIEFLRDIGRHFSVNRMLTFESYKKRLETGLSFIEFNYQLLQSYDFYVLNRDEKCLFQIGGDDQWGNIVAGVELIRRMSGNEVFGLTFPLVTRSDGKKMGKTEKGAVFLDPNLFPPFEYYQYWRNIADADVEKFLMLFTFLPVEEVRKLGRLEGSDLNRAKEILAYEQTKLIHGKDEADKARDAAKSAFSVGGASDRGAIPFIELPNEDLEEGIGILELFAMTTLCSSRSEARRLVQQGGAVINDVKIDDIEAIVTNKQLDDDGELLLRAGKKRFFRVIAK
ncbi:tyrosine--tRNA ligase [Sediminispirochaeta bajacaliforniensis]|uniref:tyrosine--tRNA ligase n=1 Tax=Sediminispirochaeta bajacaliforniensis TaxID=148 RepID=UPI00037382D4|nr:tyrosine--tRNA ligase [Sediminispirochaeta bajacaliforniensis]